MHENWIWLNPAEYPKNQTTAFSGFGDKSGFEYTVADFTRRYEFSKKVRSVKLRICADTEFRLLCNGEFVATGPANIGGDFMKNEIARPNQYSSITEIFPDDTTVDFYARVKMMPVGINEYSKGRGGFMLAGYVTFCDGTTAEISTDESWLARKNAFYVDENVYDERQKQNGYTNAVVVNNIWNTEDSPIKTREEKVIEKNSFTVKSGETLTREFDFDRIHGGFITLDTRGSEDLHIKVDCFETDTLNCSESFVFCGDSHYVGLQLRSIGKYRIIAENRGSRDSYVSLSITATHYPVTYCAQTLTSDEGINRVLRTCEHSLKYCRQMIHLDSPLHSEPLACTGDYYIEMLMTAFSYGDMELAKFDIVRTARTLEFQNGVMFHTTYSLIWVIMLRDCFMLTGDRGLLEKCRKALEMLLEKFDLYLGDNGIIENPPSYMFIDWLYIDGISLHHPPKALGQSCMNMYYYGALCAAAEIYGYLGDERKVNICRDKAEKLKKTINALLYDRQNKLFFEGLNTPTRDDLLGENMPQNVTKRYYRKHANILAVCFDVFDGDKKSLLERTLDDDSLGDFQPYFAHFAFEAIRKTGLCRKYTLQLLERWVKQSEVCNKGLAEGFIKPEPTYSFDHSHAWGGSPLYSLPMALGGIEILEPGMKKIKVKPDLYGLDFAKIEFMTPYGVFEIEINSENCRINAPKEITVV